VLRFLALIFSLIIAWSLVQAQSPSHRPSENFRPQLKSKTVVLPVAQDGDLTLEEYHRRRLIHEGKQQALHNNQGSIKLDREIDQALKELMNPAALLGFKATQVSKDNETEDSALERAARLSADLDRQIERSREEKARWEEQGQQSQPLLAQAYGDEDFENDFQESRKAQEQLQKLEGANDLSAQEMRELLRAMSGSVGGDAQMPPEYVDTMAETLYLALTPMRQMSPGEFKHSMVRALEGKPLVSALKEDHVAFDILSDFMRDPKAVPNLGLIMEDRPKLLKFFIINIVIFIAAMMWKSKHKKSLVGFTSRLRGFLTRFFTITALRLGVLVFFYGSLLTAGFNIIRTHF
jgi:hypothetical protein